MTAAPWFRARVRGWPQVRAALSAFGEPWSDDNAETDLEWWEDQIRQGLERRLPNSKALAKTWGWTEWRVRKLLAAQPADRFPRKRRETAAKAPRKRRENGRDEHGVLGQDSRRRREESAKSPRKVRDTRTLTEHRAQSTEEQVCGETGPAGAPPGAPPSDPAAPAPPTQLTLAVPAPCPAAAPAEAAVAIAAGRPPTGMGAPSIAARGPVTAQETASSDEPLWKRLGLPQPSRKTAKSLLRPRVLGVYAVWYRAYCEYREGLPKNAELPAILRTSKASLSAISEALKRVPEDVDVDSAEWPIERLVKGALVYPLRAPADAEHMWVRDRPSQLRPEFLLRDGAKNPQWRRFAQAAVALAARKAAPAGPRLVAGSDVSDADQLVAAWIAQDRAAIDQVLSRVGIEFRVAFNWLNSAVRQAEVLGHKPYQVPAFRKKLSPAAQDLLRTRGAA